MESEFDLVYSREFSIHRATIPYYQPYRTALYTQFHLNCINSNQDKRAPIFPTIDDIDCMSEIKIVGLQYNCTSEIPTFRNKRRQKQVEGTQVDR